jgi:CheY-like chemotaxis protein
VLASLQRGKRVTDEILRFTRPASPALKCIEVSKFLERWAGEIRSRLTGVIVDVTSEAEIYMHADAMQISQVLTNVAVNAAEAMPSGGTLTVSASIGKSFSSIGFGVKTVDGFIQFKCRDTGTGIPADRLPHVFEPLFSTKQSGTGLGLAISYQLIARHGGYMFVESEVGHGSTFHVLVPATHPIVAATDPAADGELHIRRILLVEDEVAVAAGMKMLLESEGVTVDVVHTGREAVPAIERVSPDAVILDIGLPDCEGTDVYCAIEKRWPQLPILFSSGHADATRLDAFLKRPNVGLLLKPYDFVSLREAIRPLMGAAVIA